MTMPRTPFVGKAFTVLCTCLVLAACSATPTSYRATCASEVDAAWNELSIAKAAGFAGGVSYTKALSLITAARSMQTVENFDGCYKNAQKARFYIRESQAGR
ncbi:MAG: hypothetical protein WC997_02985 [Porticoccaceae bacterium]